MLEKLQKDRNVTILEPLSQHTFGLILKSSPASLKLSSLNGTKKKIFNDQIKDHRKLEASFTTEIKVKIKQKKPKKFLLKLPNINLETENLDQLSTASISNENEKPKLKTYDILKEFLESPKKIKSAETKETKRSPKKLMRAHELTFDGINWPINSLLNRRIKIKQIKRKNISVDCNVFSLDDRGFSPDSCLYRRMYSPPLKSRAESTNDKYIAEFRNYMEKRASTSNKFDQIENPLDLHNLKKMTKLSGVNTENPWIYSVKENRSNMIFDLSLP